MNLEAAVTQVAEGKEEEEGVVKVGEDAQRFMSWW